MSKFRIYSERTDFDRRARLAILIEDASGLAQVAEPLVFKDVPENALFDDYTFDRPALTTRGRGDEPPLDARALMQAFLDHAWSIGMRPTGMTAISRAPWQRMSGSSTAI